MSEATTATTTTATALTISQTRTIEPRHGRFSELRQKWHVIVGGMILLMVSFISSTKIDLLSKIDTVLVN
jgi:hypothetical protein